jgi:hypothetical protein
MKRRLNARVLIIAAVLACLISTAAPVRAYDPVPALRNLSGAPHAVIWLLQVKPGREAEFVNAMVTTGPYNKLLSGFASEKLLEPLPVADGATLYICFSRYYDKGTAAFVEPERLEAITSYLTAPPARLDLSLVEHLLANWGWERGTDQQVMRTEAFKNEEIFRKNITSLSFFKAGYVGQIGMMEFFEAGSDVDAVRKTASARSGLSGASVYKIDGEDRYVVYSEFFKAPADIAARQLHIVPGTVPVGQYAGVVAQNYIPR